MFKNYLLELGGIFKNAGVIFIKNFRKNTLYIWFLAFLQIILAIPILYFNNTVGFSFLTNNHKIIWIIALIAYYILFFLMYKKIFKIATNEFQKPKLKYLRIIKGLILLGIFNSVPFLVFLLCLNIAQLAPWSAVYLKIFSNFFTYIFYFAMCLSVGAIAYYQEKNEFLAIVESFKIFFKKLKYIIPVFFVVFLLAFVLMFLICAILYGIAIYNGFLFKDLVSTIQVVVSIYSLHLIVGLSIGAQVSIIKNAEQ